MGSLVGFGMWHPRFNLVKMFNRMRHWLELGVWCPVGDLGALHLFSIMYDTVGTLHDVIRCMLGGFTCIGIRAIGVPMPENMRMYGRAPSHHHVMQ